MTLPSPTDVWIAANWPVPQNIRAFTTTRRGGVSTGPYAGLNLGAHVDDDPAAVTTNRQWLTETLVLPQEPHWLTQVHGNRIVDPASPKSNWVADGACTSQPGVVCAVLTADCLPLLLCDRAGTRVAALHGGWRGLAQGMVWAGIEQMHRPPEHIMAWLGPAIGPQVYEVGEEVYQSFLGCSADLAMAFKPTRPGHWLLDLYAIARQLLAETGVSATYGGEYCTYRMPDRFFSHRRDGVTGRMATLIWME
jgi:YfiH family protein